MYKIFIIIIYIIISDKHFLKNIVFKTGHWENKEAHVSSERSCYLKLLIDYITSSSLLTLAPIRPGSPGRPASPLGPLAPAGPVAPRLPAWP